MRWWLRSLAIGAGVGLAAGAVIGGLLGRVYMRILFLVEKDMRGVEPRLAVHGPPTGSRTRPLGVGLAVLIVVATLAVVDAYEVERLF